MPRFEFRLEVPLRLARAKRGALRRDLSQAIRATLETQLALEALGTRRREESEQLAERLRAGVAGHELREAHERAERDQDADQRLRQHLAQCEQQERQVRDELTSAGREVDTLERLRREAHQSWRTEIGRKEQAAVDDIVVTRHARAQLLERKERE